LEVNIDHVATLRQARFRFEKDFISRALIQHQGNVSATADTLGIANPAQLRPIAFLPFLRAILKPDALDATQNDLPANWCWSGDAIVHLPFTGHGSPGAANDLCP